MAKNIEHIVHKHSSSVVNNEPKLPTSSQIEYGEIAVNYSAGNETISLKNSDNQIVTFSSDNKFVKAEVLDKKEQVIASALNDLNERNNEIVEQLNDFKSDVSDNQSDINSSLNDLDTRLSSVEDIGDELIDRIDEIGQDIEDNEKVTGAALNDLNSRINALGQGSNDLEQVIIDNEEVTALALNELNSRINSINEDIEDNEMVTSAALNYLNESVEDINADLTSSYAPLDSPALTGTPTAPTASSGTNTTQIATTAFVQGEISAALGNIETLLAAI